MTTNTVLLKGPDAVLKVSLICKTKKGNLGELEQYTEGITLEPKPFGIESYAPLTSFENDP